MGVSGSALLGWLWADAVASILIGLLLIGIACFLGNETRSLIAGEAAAPMILERVRQALARDRALGEPARIRTLHLGPQTILVTICWRFAGAPGFGELQADLAKIGAEVRAADPRIADVLFEFPEDAVQDAAVSSAAPGSSADGTAPPDRPAPLRAPPA